MLLNAVVANWNATAELLLVENEANVKSNTRMQMISDPSRICKEFGLFNLHRNMAGTGVILLYCTVYS